MTRQGRQSRTAAKLLSDRPWVAAAALAGAAVLAAGLISRVAAEPRWDAIAATSTGGELAQRLAIPFSQPVGQPRPESAFLLPWPAATVALAVVPKGPWSTIVTGTVTDEPEQRRAPPGFKQLSDTVAQLEQAMPAAQAQPAAEAQGEASMAARAGAPAAQQKPLEALPPDATPVQQYCFNTADPAADARFAWQAKKISDMEAELAKRVALLEQKTEEFKTWLARRDEFSNKAQEKLVGFYTRMRPDAAALQLAEMDEETAAAVLTKLETKVAGAVMSEMEPARAAKIASIISGASKIPRPKTPKQPADGAKPQANGGSTPSGAQQDSGAAPPAQGQNRS